MLIKFFGNKLGIDYVIPLKQGQKEKPYQHDSEVTDEINNASNDTQPARNLPPTTQAQAEPTVSQSSNTPKA